MRLVDKVALVTGAASGIGKAIAQAFVAEGAIVTINDIHTENGLETEQEIRDQGGRIQFIEADVADAKDADKVVAQIMAQHKRIDILVNNAAMAYKATIADLTEEQWDRQIDVNLKSVYLYCHRIIPIMVAQGGGVIVNIGSVTSLVGVPDFAGYVTSKSGVLGITRAMALDHASQGIRVNCVCPSGIKTPLMDWQFKSSPDPQYEEQRVIDLHPVGRMADPAELAEMIVYLASDKASYITGSAFSFDGGYVAR